MNSNPQNKKKYSLLSDFLVNKKFRIWRHILLILAIAIIVMNGTFGTFGGSYAILGYKIYWIMLASLCLDLIVIYFNLYILVPKLLLKSKYLQYIVALFILVSIFLLINFSCEYYISKYEKIVFGASSAFYSETNLIVEILNSFVIYTILIVSISMTVLFRSWRINVQRIDQLETEDLRSQLENMKEKVSPSFLSRILKKSASLAIPAPQEASTMLVTLSKILRYQLYDCSRDKVLLSSEIIFLTNYLNLEKIYFVNFDFAISKNGDMTHVFIPPLLFLPFIQKSIMQVQEQNLQLFLKLDFEVGNDHLQFVCANNGIDKINYSDVSHRLELLYHNQYSIEVKNERELIIQIKI